LLEGTVILVGEYVMLFRAPTDPKPAFFAGLLLIMVSKSGGSAPRERAKLPAGTAFFVGEYGIDLLAGTVLRRRPGLRGSARGPAARLSVRWYGVLVWLLVRYPTTRITALPVGRERTPLDAHPYGVLADAEAAGRVVDR